MNPRDADPRPASSPEQHAPESGTAGEAIKLRQLSPVRRQSQHGNIEQRRSCERGILLDLTSPDARAGHSELAASPSADANFSHLSPKQAIATKYTDPSPTMVSAGLVEKPPWPEDVLQKYEKVAKLQDRYLIHQARLNHERATATARHSILVKSLSAFTKLSDPQAGKTGKRPSLRRRNAAYEQVLADLQAFEDQMQLVMELEQSLGKLEYKTAKLQGELLGLMSRCFKDEPSRRRGRSVSTSSSRRQPSSTTMDPLEQAFFEKRGDVRLLRDELFNHLSTEEADYFGGEERWQEEHQEMERELQDEEKELRRRWESCREAGLNVGELNDEIPDPYESAAEVPQLPLEEEGVIKLGAPPFLPTNNFGFVPDFLKSLHWPDRGAFVTPKLPELGNFNDKRDYINKWVGETAEVVFGPPLEPSQAIEFEYSISPPRSEPDWSFVHNQGKMQKTTDDLTLADFVVISASDGTAPNGEPLPQIGKVVRKARSGGDMRSQILKWLWRSTLSSSPRPDLDMHLP